MCVCFIGKHSNSPQEDSNPLTFTESHDTVMKESLSVHHL